MKHTLYNLFLNHPLHQEAADYFSRGCRILHWKGSSSSALALHVASLEHLTGFCQMVVMNTHEEAEELMGDLENVLGEKEYEFFRKSVLFFPAPFRKSGLDGDRPDSDHILRRTEVLKRAGSEKRSVFIITYAAALSDWVADKPELQKNTFRLKHGELVSLDFVTDFLMEYSFERVDFVSEPGQFAIRGGIVDVFSFSNDFPYRIEFFDDMVASVRSFDPATQLSKEKIDHITIVPNIHLFASSEGMQSVLSFLPERFIIWYKNIEFVSDTLDQLSQKRRKPPLDSEDEFPSHPVGPGFIDSEMFLSEISRHTTVILDHPGTLNVEVAIEVNQSPQPSFNKKFRLLMNDLSQWSEKGYKNIILSDNPKQIERLKSIFEDISQENPVQYTTALPSLHHGFIDHHLRLLCYTDHEIFERYRKTALQTGHSRREAMTLKELFNLSPGDFVSHIDHGIGRFDGLETIENNGRMQEAVRLIYKNSDILYVSIHSLHRIARYTGKEGSVPELNRLGSGTWKRLKEKTKSRVKDIARDLIGLYAKRMAASGYAFTPDNYMQYELEASFIYEDTPDQISATASVKADMEKPYPMDRLICGDVGFGKTEVAIRAAFKAVADSKQVAILVPTTILALQHYHTFKERLSEFPCQIDYLNRFRSTKDQKEILKKLANGQIDIVIGTHRLVGKDVKFKDLGLLIVDEEQKFGVSVKEKLKQLRVNVDTLTLTATPIPRTLQFSLMGARDLSVISTPPPNRYPVQTELRGFSEELIADAITYELSRGGQVFFLHNRIHNIANMADMIRKLVPGISVGIGHGQMDGEALEQVMMGFINGDFDVLVSTSIIESGLDIPNANTMIINDAHMYGLSDLHQLRGRVGRSNKRAFCYLITPPLTHISSDSRKRLKAIEEFSDLGSGFNIAMRDLDIRGAGNILGAEQSGFISDIGYEMYQRILREAMEELRATEFPDVSANAPEKAWHQKRECQIETDLEILIPAEYIESTSERLIIYRELDNTDNEENLEVIMSRLKDRFGPLPDQVMALMDTIHLRWMASDLGFEKIVLKNNRLLGYFPENQTHPYYQSEVFGDVLEFVKTNPSRCVLREKNNKLSLVIPNISNVSQAISAVSKLKKQ